MMQSGIATNTYRVMLQIKASLTDDTRGAIYVCNMFIAPATSLGENL